MGAWSEQQGIAFAAATPEMLSDMGRFLADAGLPADDLDAANLSGFELAIDGTGRIVGVAGLVVCGTDALLRSVVVVPDLRNRGMGVGLVARREETARAAGVGTIYLLTATAADFFRRLGYADIPREAVPAAIAHHAQFRSLCPASAKCLGKRL
jgi:amino-acid N-acetyltransferase